MAHVPRVDSGAQQGATGEDETGAKQQIDHVEDDEGVKGGPGGDQHPEGPIIIGDGALVGGHYGRNVEVDDGEGGQVWLGGWVEIVVVQVLTGKKEEVNNVRKIKNRYSLQVHRKPMAA